MNEQEMQFELMKSQEKVNELRQEVAEMNKEREFWQQARIQAAIAAMQAQLSNDGTVKAINDLSQEFENDKDVYLQIVVASSIRLADELIKELQKKGEKRWLRIFTFKETPAAPKK